MSNHFIEVAPGFWNARATFRIKVFVNIGTHMSLVRLSTGKFLVLDTLPLTPELKAELDTLTNVGRDIEAVVATHPFHSIYFPDFYRAYPNVPYYGTPRHLRNQPHIPWAGDVNTCDVRNKWSPEVEMRIPAGAEFVAPVPEKSNHFNCVFVYHRASRTLHVDDTIMYSPDPNFLLRLGGFKKDGMIFHITLKSVGLHHTPEAPFQFRDFIFGVLRDWDFDNICTAHFGYKVGGVKMQLEDTLRHMEPLFEQLSKRNAKDAQEGVHEHEGEVEDLNIAGNECG